MNDGLLVAAFVGGLFLYAASFKILDGSALHHTLRELGLPQRRARLGARLMPVSELVVAVVLLAPAPAPACAAVVVLAAAAIGAVGVIALRRGTPIRCSCFSAHSVTLLGWRQIVTAGILGAAGVAVAVSERRSDMEQSLLVTAIVACLVALLHLPPLFHSLQTAVHNRRATASVYPV